MFSIFDCETRQRVSDQSYTTADEANHDYYMNDRHTFVGVIQQEATQMNRSDVALIRRIATRAVALSASHGQSWKFSDCVMDITCAHNAMPLRLVELLNADDFNFAHDVFGINRHLDHDTLQLTDCFVPRYAA